MAEHRRALPQQIAQDDGRAVSATQPSRPRIGPKLAHRLMVVARDRMKLGSFVSADTTLNEQNSTVIVHPVDDNAQHKRSVRQMLAQRWQAERPYQGVPTNALRRKLATGSLNEALTKAALHELEIRRNRFAAFI